MTRKPTLMRIEYNNLIREKREREEKKRLEMFFVFCVFYGCARSLLAELLSFSSLVVARLRGRARAAVRDPIISTTTSGTQ